MYRECGMKGRVVSLCDLTGNMVRPWAEVGYECYCIDMQHPKDFYPIAPNVWGFGGDVMRWDWQIKTEPVIAFAFPPCTNLAGSGARWFKGKGLRGLIDGLAVVERCRELCESFGCPWMLENPVGTLSTYWREPDAKFDPYEYGGYLDPEGDAYTKRTCLWYGGGFVMPQAKPVYPSEGSRMHFVSPGPDRANIRSETPMGFARAVFEANSQALVSGK